LVPALAQRKEISGRRARQILFRALRKDLHRWRIVAEKDRQSAGPGAEFRQAFVQELAKSNQVG
jgi:hypothetical protein